jgi:cell division protein FtsB
LGYGGGAPGWVYNREMAYHDMAHQSETSRLQSEIEGLKKENQELKDKNVKLEAENKDLRSYIDALKS